MSRLKIKSAIIVASSGKKRVGTRVKIVLPTQAIDESFIKKLKPMNL